MSNQPDTLDSEPDTATMEPVETAETAARHADQRTIGLEIRDGDVATVLRGRAGAEVLDTAAEWRQQIGDRPVLILARMLASLSAWADQYGAEPIMPAPDVLDALRPLG